MSDSSTPHRGRPRDAAIASCVLHATLTELAGKGYAALSLTAIAEAAGTTRPALYRRWKSKAALVVDAVAYLAETKEPPVTGDPFTDLVAELDGFQHCITEPGALPLAALMLSDETDQQVRDAYLDRIVVPRRARITTILTAGIASGALRPDTDLEIASSLLTGSWYSYRIAGTQAPDDWAERTAALVWQACAATRHSSRAESSPQQD